MKNISSRMILISFVFSIAFLHSFAEQPGIIDSTEIYKVIIKVDYINDDAVKDTIISTADSTRIFKPRYLVWGKDTVDNGIPDSLKVDYTTLDYPNSSYQKLKITSNFERINPDTLLDLIIIYRGVIPDSVNGDRDTACAIVIFGKRGLDTIHTITIADIDTFQIEPFVAMHMRKDHELKDPLIWDFSYLPIYIVNEIDLDVNDTSHIPPPITPTGAISETGPGVRLYPNPAIYYTNMEINGIKPGEYLVQIFNIGANVIHEQELIVETQGDLIKRIDLAGLSTGSYIFRLSKNRIVIGVYRIVIVK